MNLPNKLTVFRVLLIPLFMALYLTGNTVWAGALFILASVTDFADGFIARKKNLTTNFGKFMDPLADKLLVTAAFLCFLEKGMIPSWIVMIVLAREFIVTGIRLIVAADGTVIAAGQLGKIKTVMQLIAVLVMLFFGKHIITDILIYLSTVMTVISGVDYIINNRYVFKQKN